MNGFNEHIMESITMKLFIEGQAKKKAVFSKWNTARANHNYQIEKQSRYEYFNLTKKWPEDES